MKLKRFKDYIEDEFVKSGKTFNMDEIEFVATRIAIDDIITRQEEILDRLDKLEKQEYEEWLTKEQAENRIIENTL